jgi:hypothetical protein
MSDDVQPIIGPYVSRPAACLDYDPQAAEVARLVTALTSASQPKRRPVFPRLQRRGRMATTGADTGHVGRFRAGDFSST